MSELKGQLKDRENKLDQVKEKLNSAWYIIGTEDELKEKGLVLRNGFFDDNNMSEDFDKSHFKKVNINDLKEIILNGKKANIITTHPSESYELMGIKKKVNRLIIKNPEDFWSASKYLIIEIE